MKGKSIKDKKNTDLRDKRSEETPSALQGMTGHVYSGHILEAAYETEYGWTAAAYCQAVGSGLGAPRSASLLGQQPKPVGGGAVGGDCKGGRSEEHTSELQSR